MLNNLTKADTDNLKLSIKQEYNEDKPGNALNKCLRFCNELKVNDIALIVDKNSIAIARIGKYYEVTSSIDLEKDSRLADRYITVTDHDCDLANEWWTKFTALSPEKLEKAKNIIALNKFKDGDYDVNDEEIFEVLSYYKITRNDLALSQMFSQYKK